MSTTGSQILFLGELPFWLKITQSILEECGIKNIKMVEMIKLEDNGSKEMRRGR